MPILTQYIAIPHGYPDNTPLPPLLVTADALWPELPREEPILRERMNRAGYSLAETSTNDTHKLLATINDLWDDHSIRTAPVYDHDTGWHHLRFIGAGESPEAFTECLV